MQDVTSQTQTMLVMVIGVCAIVAYLATRYMSRWPFHLPLLDLLSYSIAGVSIIVFASTVTMNYSDTIRSQNPELIEANTDREAIWQQLKVFELQNCPRTDSLDCREIGRLRPVIGSGKTVTVRTRFNYDPAVSSDLRLLYDELNETYRDIARIQHASVTYVLSSWRTIALAMLVIAYVFGVTRRVAVLVQALSSRQQVPT